MTDSTVTEFRKKILKEIGLNLTSSQTWMEQYKKKNGDSLVIYKKDGCYDLGIADYSIPHDFSLVFDTSTRLVRFGIVYRGTTSFQLNNEAASSFSPSSFFVLEDHVAGTQSWKEGQHFHGIEVTILADYLDALLSDYNSKPLAETDLIPNHTYNFLPIKLVQCIQQLHALSNSRELTPIYLHGKILECIAILYNELFAGKGEAFLNQSYYDEISIGKRSIHLNASDLSAIQEAYHILTENVKNPPTIDMLSKMVLLNSQKLKAGFYHHYHMTIGEYITSLRMSTAAILLCTTNDHIHDIAAAVGYAHTANFIKMFKKQYYKTPLQYRLDNRS